MNLIIEKYIFREIFDNLFSNSKHAKIKDIISVLYNNDNKILFSEFLLDSISKEFEVKYQFWESIFTNMVDDNRFVPISNSSSQKDEYSEVKDIYNICKTRIDNLFIISEKNNHIYDSISQSHICCWNSIGKPNKCWLLLQLAANRQVNVRYSNFSSDKQIRSFFESFIQLPTLSKDIIVFDSYCNNHDLFDCIIGKGYNITFCTSAINQNQVEIEAKKNILKKKYGKNKTKAKFSTNKKLTHPRSVSIGDFTLKTDHDFAEIKRANNNWDINIYFDQERKIEIGSIMKEYS